MNHLQIETKFSVDPAGAIEGVAWPFGSADRVGDVIEKGAFSTASPPLPILWSHDQAETIGVWDSIAETDAGLVVKGRLLIDDVPRAREVRALLQAGAVRGLSIGFAAKKAAPRKGGGRTIGAVDLLEISIVAVPAHPGARVTTTKELPVTDTTTVAPAPAAEPVIDTKAMDAIQARLDKIEAKANRPQGVPAADGPTLEQKAFNIFVRRGREELNVDEAKALTVSSDTAGGYLVPEQLAGEILKNIVQFSPVRQLASVAGISTPEITFPTQTGASNASWVGETADRTSSDLTFGQLRIGVHELATYVDVSQQLLEDSAFDLESYIAADLGEQFGKKEATAFVTGDAVGKPSGFLVDTNVATMPSGAAAAISADNIVDLYHQLASPYVANASWLMNRATMGVVRKMKDGDGRYLWADSLAAGYPGTLLGRPVYEAVDLPNVAAAARPIVFGDFRAGYRVFDRVALSILRDPYSLATKGQVRFHARRRVGGAVVKAEAIKILRVAAS